MNVPWPLHYDLHLDLYPEEVGREDALYGGTLRARCRLRLANRGPSAATTIPFLLYRLLEIHEVRWNGQRIEWTERVAKVDGLPRWQVLVVEISLSMALEPDQQGVLEVDYSGPVCGYREVFPYAHDRIDPRFTLLRRDEVLFVPLPGYPSLELFRRIPDERFTFTLRATTERDLVVVTAGKGQHERVEGSVVHRWESHRPDWRLDVAIGDYVQAKSEDWPGVTVYHFAGDQQGAALCLQAGADAYRVLGSRLGKVPCSLNVIAVPDGYGGQATETHLLVERSNFQMGKKEATHHAYARVLGPLAHEIAHLWSIPSGERVPSRFLDEAVAHYLETVVSRELLGDKAPSGARMEEYRAWFLQGGEEAVTTPLVLAGGSPARDAIARGKGPWLLAVWEELAGKDAVLDALRTLLEFAVAGGRPLDYL